MMRQRTREAIGARLTVSCFGAAGHECGEAGVDPDTTEELQVTFVSAITSAAFSLSATRRLDYAWASFRGMIDSGKMLNPKKK